ncbi:Cytochrome c oxidase subunit 5B, mitochondrial [Malassezia cuniculi]|uniref:Cytochrome c oxidase subunit 5B, mitochondrial n=1 Tax=Malassezia cuniculi TaxID=948313 RepID=A0AAF0ER45_9BASI|nr:Cytochrome c oxidase subunit 5B, mitochondrial [Malassezia cuniculi]
MIGSVRPSLLRVVPRAPALTRSLIVRSERWTPAVARQAEASGTTVELAKILPNIESHWTKISKEEQYAVYKALEEVQRKDWNELTLDEKKGAYFVAYGPYGPRKPVVPKGQTVRVVLGTALFVGLGIGIFAFVRSLAAPAPKTLSPDYREQMTERAKENKQNPITGMASEGYKGKGF